MLDVRAGSSHDRSDFRVVLNSWSLARITSRRSFRTISPGKPVAWEFCRQTSSCYRLRQAKCFGPMGEMNLTYSHVIMTMESE
jgi:hypothetical protein